MMRQLRRFLRPYQGFLLPVGILAVCVVIIFLGIFPGVRQAYELFGHVSDERGELADLRAKASLLSSLDEQALFDRLNILSLAIPLDKSVPTILSTVDGVSGKTGTIFSSMQLTAPGSLATEAAKRQTTEEAALGSYLLPFTLTMDGNFQQLRDTLVNLTGSRRLFRIKNFTISFTAAGVGRALLSMDAFYAPLPKSIAAVNKKLIPLSQKEEATLTQVNALPLLTGSAPPAAVSSNFLRTDPFSPFAP